MSLVILTGASGAGKTTIAKRLAADTPSLTCLFFDSIGVPSTEEMIAKYGSGEEWQKAMTVEWLKRIKTTYEETAPVLLEGQSRISFIIEALAANQISNASIILIDCDDETRRTRLALERNQPELANDQMMNWARFLRKEADGAKVRILDTSYKSISEAAKEIKTALGL